MVIVKVSEALRVKPLIREPVSWWSRLKLLCIALLFIGCADEASDGSVEAAEPALTISVPVLDSAPADMHALVPADSLVYVQAVSLEALKDAVAAYQGLISQRDIIQDPREWLSGLGLFDPSRVDTERPCALVVGPADVGFPVTIIVGSSDPGALSRTAPLGIGVFTQGDYVAFSPLPDVGPLGSPLTTDLPAGSIAGRIDLPPLMEAGRKYFEVAMGLAQVQAASQPMPPTVDVQKVMAASAEMMRGVMDAVESLEFAIGQDGPEVEFRGELMVKDGSPLGGFTPPAGGNLADLASRIDPDAAVVMLARADIGQVMDRSEEVMRLMMDAYFTGMDGGPDLDEMMGAWSALYRLGLGTFASSISLEEGLDGWYVVEATNPAAMVSTYTELAEDGMFNMPWMQVEALSTNVVDGVPVPTFQSHLDMAQLYGDVADPQMREHMERSMELMSGDGDRWLTHFMYAGDRVGMTFGSEGETPDAAAIDAISRPERPVPPAIAALVQELDTHDAGIALRFDLLSYMQMIMSQIDPGFTSQSPEEAAGSSNMTMTAAVSGNRWDLAGSMDLGTLLEYFASVEITQVGH